MEAGKENEQTLANLSPAEEATSKDEVEIGKSLQAQNSENTQYKTKSDLNTWKKFCESLKESIEQLKTYLPEWARPSFVHFFLISVRKQDGSEYEPCTLSGFQRRFNATCMKNEVWSTFLRITSSPVGKERLFCLHTLTKFVQSCTLNSYHLSPLNWRLVTEVSQLNAWARAAGNK